MRLSYPIVLLQAAFALAELMRMAAAFIFYSPMHVPHIGNLHVVESIASKLAKQRDHISVPHFMSAEPSTSINDNYNTGRVKNRLKKSAAEQAETTQLSSGKELSQSSSL